MIEENPYKILGIEENASDEEVKKAFKKLALKYHPDRAKDAEERTKNEEEFKKINSALQRIQSGNVNTGFLNGQDFDPFVSNFNDIFSSFFNQRVKKKVERAIAIEFSLDQLKKGCKKEFIIEEGKTCEKCNGEHFLKKQPCIKCKGRGMLIEGNQFMMSQRTCDKCHGLGFSFEEQCKECDQNGQKKFQKKYTIVVPPAEIIDL
jgi:molecular chaperone DnaJ